ncbi:MAG: methylated-DNA--[protein]-cysteine S-methyltransferase [Zoogloeaceae bacterium]|nr:methylated-DNA--[protein]-cysteine S-methyltransferase [Zoogloeaceae bacterium]
MEPQTQEATDGFDAILGAPGFCLGLRCEAGAVTEIRFLEPCAERAPVLPLAREAAQQLAAWLGDARCRFDLPMRMRGSPFQQRVWAQIRAIPLGETRTYGALARMLESAPRPVGGACGANPLPVLVPCHRVVARDGGLGGFSRKRGGFLLDIKRWLLAHETAATRP